MPTTRSGRQPGQQPTRSGRQPGQQPTRSGRRPGRQPTRSGGRPSQQPTAIRIASLAVSALVLAYAPDAAAEDIRLAVTNTTLLEYRIDNQNGREDDDDYGTLIDRLNLTFSSGNLTAATRFDIFQFLSPPNDDFQGSVRLERFSLVYQDGPWKLIGGDYFRQLGRGFLLALRKLDEAARDLSLRGAQAEFRGDVHRFSLFGGEVNPANIDAVSQKFVEDTEDFLAGGHYELAAFDGLTLGAHGLYSQASQRIVADERDYDISGGLYAELPSVTEWLSVYLEADLQQRNLAGNEQIGLALYNTLDFSFGDWSVLVESMAIDRFETRGSPNTALNRRFNYNQGPTLERIDQQVLQNRDVVGSRVRVDRFIESIDLLLYINGVLRLEEFFEAQREDGRDPAPHRHVFGGFEHNYDGGNSRLFLTGGFRSDGGSETKTMAHWDVDFLHELTSGVALHIVSNMQFWTRNVLGVSDGFVQGSTFVGIDWAGIGGFTVEVGHDTLDTRFRELFVAGILIWEASEAVRVTATGGTQRGGLKCINGICRFYPEFAGGRLAVVVRL